MKKTSGEQLAFAGFFGVLLVEGGAGRRRRRRGEAGGDGPFDADGDTLVKFSSGFACEGRARYCVNGAINSGNTKDAGNVRTNGNPSNSGSPVNNSGSNNSGNTGTGAAAASANHMQRFGPLRAGT
ncbi:hypothetical protein [Streptomyces sp. WZ-12]|uniref:hypothetical protein n=1 Tax=Streptomyces sp. WZ-12 TaxID=3030210 RepID=UPI002380C4AA|nr:hypothetical protein [Streptomyces sp. WZ-12]